MLSAWGRVVHRRRGIVLAVSALLLAVSIGGVLRGGTLSTNPQPRNVEAGHAFDRMDEDIAKQPGSTFGSSFTIIFRSSTLRADDAAFEDAVARALAPLFSDPRVTNVTEGPTSRDGHARLVTVTLAASFDDARKDYRSIRNEVASEVVEIMATGSLPITASFDEQLARDLEKGEIISLPLVLILLVAVFGTIVAALLPIGVGILAVVGGVGGVYAISHVTDVSTYAINIVTLIGLGVAIDYSLFVVSRYREELRRSGRVDAAIARTMATAGRTVLFSGLTVAIGLSGLLFFNGTFLASMGMAGAIVVAFAVFYALTFLPAVLCVLGHRLEKGNFHRRPASAEPRPGFWHALALGVMRRPVVILVPVLALLVVAGAPFLHLRLANGDFHTLPPSAEARRGIEFLESEFAGESRTTLFVVADFPGEPLTKERIGSLYDLSHRLAAIPGVLRVSSVVDADPNLTREQVVGLLSQPRASWPPALQEAAAGSVGAHIVVLQVASDLETKGDAARDLVKAIRVDRAVGDGSFIVGGQAAYDVDFIAYIESKTPIAVAFIVVVTYVLLLVQVGSVLIPLKAVVMNLLSISASFGALVWIFQDGHFSSFLGFTPQPIDPTLPVIMFCIVFGLSMDYEVLLLSRMREEWLRSHDNRGAVAWGLERSGALITGAAAIMVIVFAAFALSSVVIIKAIGLGLALAVLVDATLVRALVVPATMRLLGQANWWAPRWLERLSRPGEH